jgi:tetratricopeptide (TPR) repeat protein
VLKIERRNAALYNLRGTTYYQKKDYDRAEADYNEAVRIDPKYVIAYINLAILHQGIIDRHLELVKEYKQKVTEYGEEIADR